LAADGKPEARSAIFAARGAIGLLEGFEDNALLVGLDADSGIRDREGDRGFRPRQSEMTAAPSRRDTTDREPHRAAFGELEGVRKQILEHLLEPFGVGMHALARERR